jgi:5'-methylthioadenosine phosphorylase
MSAIAIFGGTAAYNINPADFADVVETTVLETPYGRSPHFLKLRTAQGTAVWFSSRHGENELARSARFVNHRANIWAVRELGANLILSWNGVGAINPELRVGQAVVPAAIMDWTRHRIHSFGEKSHPLRQAARTIEHIENSYLAEPRHRLPHQTAHPFHEPTRQALLASIQYSVSTVQSPVYVCTEGPRLETAAEINLAAALGADVVGMTLCPEVWLAAELGLHYASLCLITNFATGRWHIDPRRDFGASVAERALPVLLDVADRMNGRQDDKVTK